MVALQSGSGNFMEKKLRVIKNTHCLLVILLIVCFSVFYVIVSHLHTHRSHPDQTNDSVDENAVKTSAIDVEVNNNEETVGINANTLKNELDTLSKEILQIKDLFEYGRRTQKINDKLNHQKIKEIVPSSDDTGIFVHTNVGIELCGRTTLKLLILVLGSYEELSERLTIRSTWAKGLNYFNTKEGRRELKWKTVFVVSTPGDNSWPGNPFFETELNSKRDILRVEVQEHVSMQGVKLYSALMWALNNCNFKYVLLTKVQHFINIPVLYEFLHSKDLPETLYAGKFVTKEVQVPKTPINSNRGVWVNKTTTLLESEAMVLSYNIVKNGIREFNLYSNVRPIDPRIMVSEIMNKMNIKPWPIANFIQNTNCSYDDRYFLNYEPKTECYEKMYKQYLEREL